MDLAEEHRLHIRKWFYDCPYEMHTGLGEMYVADERFTAFYDAMQARVSPSTCGTRSSRTRVRKAAGVGGMSRPCDPAAPVPGTGRGLV